MSAFHEAHPLLAGMGREELRGKLPPVVDPRLFQRILALACEKGHLLVDGDLVKQSGHLAARGGAGGALRSRLIEVLQKAGLTPPWLSDLPAATGATAPDVQAVLKLLCAEGTVVRISADLYCDAAATATLRERLVAYLREHKDLTTQQFKELVGATRKHVIPLAEYFDREKITLRVGEKRVLRSDRA